MTEVIFYVSMTLTVASFALFAWLALATLRPPAASPPIPPGVQQQGAIPSAKEIAELAEKLSKAGPMATAATLAVLFLLTSLLASGLVSVSVATPQPSFSEDTPTQSE